MSQTCRRRVRRTPEQVRTLVEEYRRSGQNAYRFCAEHHIPSSTLYRYLTLDRAKVRPSPVQAEPPCFIPVTVADNRPEPSCQSTAFKLHLSGDRVLAISPGFDADDLHRLLEVLGC